MKYARYSAARIVTFSAADLGTTIAGAPRARGGSCNCQCQTQCQCQSQQCVDLRG